MGHACSRLSVIPSAEGTCLRGAIIHHELVVDDGWGGAIRKECDSGLYRKSKQTISFRGGRLEYVVWCTERRKDHESVSHMTKKWTIRVLGGRYNVHM